LRLALAEPSERDKLRIAESLADLGGLTEGVVCSRGIASMQAPQCDRQEQVTLLHAFELAGVEQALGPIEPAATSGQLTTDQQEEGQPERASCSSRGFA
jgi:hypothetical protein